MTDYFLADLHLGEAHPELTQMLLDFLRTKAADARAVFVLGDLFDFWIGDDEQSPLTDEVAQAFRKLADGGTACFFIHGNRDFLIGRRFAAKAGLTLLPEYYAYTRYGRRILLCHGDTLCIGDRGYQRFRRVVHMKWLQNLFLRLPLARRIALARKIRRKSSSGKQTKPVQIMDVDEAFTAATARRFGADLLIHGHTHRQAVHETPGLTRIVLGDWRPGQASVLALDEQGFRFLPSETPPR